MTDPIPRWKSEMVLGIIKSYAPDEIAKQVCDAMMAEMQIDGHSEDKIVEMLAGSLIDGLRFGNWPWFIRYKTMEKPHSRACGIRKHDHGPDCSRNCPSCAGRTIKRKEET